MENQFVYRVSNGNSKTGPMLTTYTTSNSCPKVCPLKGTGCYAETGMVGMHWRRIDANTGDRNVDLDGLITAIRAVPKGGLWRTNVAGDLVHENERIDASVLSQLVQANRGRNGFTYTHHEVVGSAHNRALVQAANANGFTINLSANDIRHADELAALAIAPVTVLLPIDAPKVSYTPAGRTIVVCPAVTIPDMTCAKCGLCANASRRSIVGFPAHGARKNKLNKVIMMKTDSSKTNA